MTLTDHITNNWPKLLDWLNREVKVGELIKHSEETPFGTEYSVHHPGILFNSSDGDYRLVFSVKITCFKLEKFN